MSLKMNCHSNGISLIIDCHSNVMSLKRECDSKENFTKNAI